MFPGGVFRLVTAIHWHRFMARDPFFDIHNETVTGLFQGVSFKNVSLG
jgi:hypothetical protein